MPQLPDDLWRQINQSAPLKAALLAKANRVAGRARAITSANEGSATISVEYGIRPGGRARVNVVSSDAEEEFGREGKKRTRALGRAARGG